MDAIPGFQKRALSKQDFVLMLLRCRSYFLRLQPATRRSLGGVHLAASRAALEDLAEVCRQSGIRVILFHAPTNPKVPLYGTPGDDRSYHEFATGLASRYSLTMLDFEHSIPEADWGMALNVPDPLHLSRQGHRRMAELMLAELQKNGL
jgi:lysophospholipase L1-like esterase